MKNTIIAVLVVLLIGVGTYFYFENNQEGSEGISYTEIKETEEGFMTDMVIEKGDYEEGDIIYLTYTVEANEVSVSNFFIPKVFALEEDDVIAYHEVTAEDVKTLKEKNLSISVELTLTDDEVKAIGAQNLSKHIRVNKVKNNNEEKKLQIKNKYQQKEQEYVQYKAQKAGPENGNADSGSGNQDSGSNN